MALCALLATLSASTSAVLLSSLDETAPGLNYHLPRTLLILKFEVLGREANDVVTELTPAEVEAAGPGVVRVSARIDGQTHSVLVNKQGALANRLVTSLRLVDATPDHVADLSYNYVLQYNPNAGASDRVCMGVDEKGLLNYVEAATKDETANIIVSIAKFFGRIAGPGAFTVSGTLQKLNDFTITIDPYDERDRRSVGKMINERFPELGDHFEFAVEGFPQTKAPSSRDSCPVDRICYRTVVPVRVGLFDRRSKRSSVRYAMVANLSEVNTIDVRRALFIEKVTRLGFTDGVLSYARINKPSEALEAAKLPLTVYDAVITSALAAPGQFLGQIKPGADPNTVLGIINLQAQTATQINELLDQLQRLREATPPNGQPGQPPSGNTPFQITCAGPASKAAGGKSPP